MGTQADLTERVGKLCRLDTPEHVGAAIDIYVEGALRVYSRDRPFEDVEDVTGSGAKLQTTPTNWSDRWSLVRKVVYPYSDEDSDELDENDYETDSVPVTGSPVEKIRFVSEMSAANTVRIWFSRPHADNLSTVYTQDLIALAFLTASMVEGAKASFFLGMKDQGVTSDLVDYGQKSNEARALAKAHYATYRQVLGLPAKEGPVPRSVVGDIDTGLQSGTVSHQRHHRSVNR